MAAKAQQPDDHSADGEATIEIEAKDRGELFVAVADAFLAAVTRPQDVQPREARTLERTAPSLPDLLRTWVTELLVLYASEQTLVGRTRVAVDDLPEGAGVRLHATLWGEPVQPDRHPVRLAPSRCEVRLLADSPTYRTRLRIAGPATT